MHTCTYTRAYRPSPIQTSIHIYIPARVSRNLLPPCPTPLSDNSSCPSATCRLPPVTLHLSPATCPSATCHMSFCHLSPSTCQVQPVLDVLDLMRDQYHHLLLTDSLRQLNDTLANDKFEQMVMRKEYEYSMNVLAFHIQSTDIMPAFPYIAPFSATVPECCRIVRSFIDASVSFLQHSGQMDQYDAVKKYLDRLLTDVLNSSMLKIIHTPTLAVSHAMQVTYTTK